MKKSTVEKMTAVVIALMVIALLYFKFYVGMTLTALLTGLAIGVVVETIIAVAWLWYLGDKTKASGGK